MGRFRKSVCLSLLVFISFLSFITGGEIFNKNSYDGTVLEYAKPGLQSDIRFGVDGFNGLVTWIIPAGSFVKGPIYNSKGKIVRQGDVLIKADVRFYEYEVKVKKAELEAAKADLNFTDTNCKRYKKLAMVNSVSKKEYDLALADYLKAKAHLISAMSELQYSKLLLEECTIYAPYSGYVQEVFTRVGSWCNVDYPGLRLMRLSPLFVDVEMSRNLAKEIIDDEYSVIIHTNDNKTEINTNNSKMSLIEKGLRISVKNHLKKEVLNKINGKVIHDYSYIIDFGPIPGKLGVPSSVLYQESSGKYYVWLAVDKKTLKPSKSLKSIFSIKKVYVTPANLLKNTPLSGWLRLLKNPGTLQRDDIIINDVNADFKDGDSIEYVRFDGLFWPGDKVKIVLKKN
jgi:hypothetical protein